MGYLLVKKDTAMKYIGKFLTFEFDGGKTVYLNGGINCD
jgi:hypothetical protein